ncbi:hypothetical protein RA876_16045 [Rhodoferax antarcticus]|nr:hypothetical protein RA876_16045 [Rhodoferax antarcticus]
MTVTKAKIAALTRATTGVLAGVAEISKEEGFFGMSILKADHHRTARQNRWAAQLARRRHQLTGRPMA